MSEARRGRRMPFVILPWAVLDHELLTAHDVLVYATIARYADVTTGVAWPSRQTVAQNARCDIKTVDRSVTRLVAAGFLEKHKRKTELGESNLYIVHEIVAHQETLKPRSRGRDSNGATPGDSNGAGTRTTRTRKDRAVRMDRCARRRACSSSSLTGRHIMKVLTGFAIGVAVTALILPITTTVYERVTEIETVEVEVPVQEAIDYEQLLNVLRQPQPSDADTAADYECAQAIARLTGDPLAGIGLYVGKYYDGDACSAYMHQVRHGWY